MDWEYVPFEEVEVKGALVVVGVPSIGMVGPIGAGFLVKQLGMRMIGSFQSDGLPPMGVVRQGVVTSPVQVWASEVACGLDGQCDRLLVLKSDVPLAPPLLPGLASEVSRWASRERVGLVVGLEGVPTDVGDLGSIVAAHSVLGAEAAKGLGAEGLVEGVLPGFNAALLVRANRDRLPAVCLFVPTGDRVAEAKGAATLLQRVDPLLPNIPFKAEELEKQAEVIEGELRDEIAKQALQQEKMEHALPGYH